MSSPRTQRTHHELQAWQHSIALVKEIYRLTAAFPSSEVFGLTAQMRRCAVSIPSNIAEGAARNTKKEFLHFLGMARGSLSELETQPILARELGFYHDTGSTQQQLDQVFALLGRLMRSLRGSLSDR